MQPLLFSHLVTVPSDVRDHRWYTRPVYGIGANWSASLHLRVRNAVGVLLFRPRVRLFRDWAPPVFCLRRFYTIFLIDAECGFRLPCCDLLLPTALGVTLEG